MTPLSESMFEPPASPCSLASEDRQHDPEPVSGNVASPSTRGKKRAPRGVSLDCILPKGTKRLRRKKVLDLSYDEDPVASRSLSRKRSKKSSSRKSGSVNGKQNGKFDMIFVDAGNAEANTGFVDQLNISAADERRKFLLQKLRMIDAEKAKLASEKSDSTELGDAEKVANRETRTPIVPSLDISSIAHQNSSEDVARIGARLRGFAQETVLNTSSPVPSETSQDGVRRRASRSRTPSVLLSRLPGEIPGVYKPPGTSQCKRLTFCKRIVNEMLRNPAAKPFSAPVNELWPPESIPRYFDVIARPMDFSTIKKKLEAGDYLKRDKTLAPEELLDVGLFENDVKQVFRNAMIYNSSQDFLYNSAKKLLTDFEMDMGKLPGIERRINRRVTKKAKTSPRKVGSPLTPRRKKARSPVSKRSAKSTTKVKSTIATSPLTPQIQVQDGMDLRQLKSHVDDLRTHRSYLEMAMASPVVTTNSNKGHKHVALLYAMEMTPEEKAELTENIAKLPVEKVDKLVAIIRSSGQQGLGGNQQEGELELDIDQFDNKLLRDLELYVESVLDVEAKEKKKKEAKSHLPFETIDEVDAAIRAAEDKILEIRNSKASHKKEKSFYDMDDDSSSDSGSEKDSDTDGSGSESEDSGSESE